MDRAAQIASLALEALLAEAAATPKPGLVDRVNCGAHADMDFFTFQVSAAAIAPFLSVFVRTGTEHTGDASALLARLRPVGMEAERAMFVRTGGVNTHKGAIFSFGVLLGAAGLALRRGKKCTAECVLDLVKEICAGVWMFALPRRKEMRRTSPAVRRVRAGRQRQGSPLCAVSLCRSIAR